jgi:ribosomal-protein-alanine N-acetyltransferase
LPGAGRLADVTADLATARLDVRSLSLPLIEALLTGDLAQAAALAPYPIDASTFDGDEHVLRLRRDQLRADPTELPWLYRAAVLRAHGVVVARGGFHAPPDADGTVEIGYRVAPAWRGQGVASELARGLLDWARTQGAARCLASVSPDNAASLAIVRRLGFAHTGEQMDEVDGLELVNTLELR